MKIEITKKIKEENIKQIYSTWNSVYPLQANFKSMADFKIYLEKAVDQRHYVFRNNNGVINGWLMTFNRDNKRNFVLLVNEDKQNNGIGTCLVEEMQKIETEVVGWVVVSDAYLKANGSNYRSPINFYKKHNFYVTDERCDTNNLLTVRIAWSASVKK